MIDSAKKVTGVDFPVVEEKRRAGDPAVLIASSARFARSLAGSRSTAVLMRLSALRGSGIRDIRMAIAAKSNKCILKTGFPGF